MTKLIICQLQLVLCDNLKIVVENKVLRLFCKFIGAHNSRFHKFHVTTENICS